MARGKNENEMSSPVPYLFLSSLTGLEIEGIGWHVGGNCQFEVNIVILSTVLTVELPECLLALIIDFNSKFSDVNYRLCDYEPETDSMWL